MTQKEGTVLMKKLFPIAIVLAGILALCIPVVAASLPEGEDVVYYRKEGSSQVWQTTGEVVELSGETEETVQYGIDQLAPEDFLCLPTATVEKNSRLEFSNALPGDPCSDFLKIEIKDGEATLKIDTCVWAPETNDLEIGIYNWSTAENWYVLKSGGKVSNYSKNFVNLTAGTYSVYILNRGKNTLTTGYMLYTLT